MPTEWDKLRSWNGSQSARLKNSFVSWLRSNTRRLKVRLIRKANPTQELSVTGNSRQPRSTDGRRSFLHLHCPYHSGNRSIVQ